MRFTAQPFGNPKIANPVSQKYLADEQELLRELAEIADAGDSVRARIQETAAGLVRSVRKNAEKEGGIDAFLQQYDLSSEEGVLLMCIAEALLRIPDADTADRLIADAEGMRAVIVNGQIIREDGRDAVDPEGPLPGQLLRSAV